MLTCEDEEIREATQCTGVVCPGTSEAFPVFFQCLCPAHDIDSVHDAFGLKAVCEDDRIGFDDLAAGRDDMI